MISIRCEPEIYIFTVSHEQHRGFGTTARRKSLEVIRWSFEGFSLHPAFLPHTSCFLQCSSRFCKKTNITTKIQMLGSFFLFQPYHLCENQPFWPRDLDCSQPSSGSLLPSCIFEPSQGKKRQHRPQSWLGIHNYPVWKCHNDRTLRCQYVFIHITYKCIHIYMLFLSAINICCA